MIESINPLMTHVIEPLRDGLLSSDTIVMLAWIVLNVLAIAVPVIVSVAFYVVWERKLIGWMQIRLGPNRVGPLGLLQPIADGMKLFLKEIKFVNEGYFLNCYPNSTVGIKLLNC